MCRSVKDRLTAKDERHFGIGRAAIDAGCEVSVGGDRGARSAFGGHGRAATLLFAASVVLAGGA